MLCYWVIKFLDPTPLLRVPATGSNNLIHPLLETNIGFDTSSKVYANLIGGLDTAPRYLCQGTC